MPSKPPNSIPEMPRSSRNVPTTDFEKRLLGYAHLYDRRKETALETLKAQYPSILYHVPEYLHEALIPLLNTEILEHLKTSGDLQKLRAQFATSWDDFRVSGDATVALWSGGPSDLILYGDRPGVMSHSVIRAVQLQHKARNNETVLMLENTGAGQYAESLATLLVTLSAQFEPEKPCIAKTEHKIFQLSSKQFLKNAEGEVIVYANEPRQNGHFRGTELAQITDPDSNVTHIRVAHVHRDMEEEVYAKPTTIDIRDQSLITLSDTGQRQYIKNIKVTLDDKVDAKTWVDGERKRWMDKAVSTLDRFPALPKGMPVTPQSPYEKALIDCAGAILRAIELITSMNPYSPQDVNYNAHIMEFEKRLTNLGPVFEKHPMLGHYLQQQLSQQHPELEAMQLTMTTDPQARLLLGAVMGEEVDTSRMAPILYGCNGDTNIIDVGDISTLPQRPITTLE